jgi:hypothetical protein
MRNHQSNDKNLEPEEVEQLVMQQEGPSTQTSANMLSRNTTLATWSPT